MIPFEHLIILDNYNKTPKYKQIAFSIIHAIRDGLLKPGSHLPGSRELARILNVHRKTVIAAYDELETQEWVKIIPRKYVAVSEDLPVLQPIKWDIKKNKIGFESDMDLPFRTIDSENLIINKTAEITIDDGHPDIRISPIQELLKNYQLLTSKRHSVKKINLGALQGTENLRNILVAYLSETRGLNISSDNILITHGAQMSIYLCAQLLLNKDSNIIIGKPNYPTANNTFKEANAHLIEVSVDNEGIDTKAIEIICQTMKITAVYVVPHHHYPTTVTLSAERRMHLLELSKKYKFVIIEDDYDYDYHFSSAPYLPLASAAHQGNIIYIGSFSKMIDPSLRVGFMIASKNFIKQATIFRKNIDGGGDGYIQNALAVLIKNGELKRHLNKAKKIYHKRRDFLDGILRKELNNHISYQLPSGGMAIWIRLNKNASVEKLNVNNKLNIPKIDKEHNAFRFGFASMSEEELEKTVLQLKINIEK